jgi:hypothetical protein
VRQNIALFYSLRQLLPAILFFIEELDSTILCRKSQP